MTKQYIYEFNGTISIEAKNEDEAEELVTGINLNSYLIDEDLFEVDESYIPTDLDKRVEQWGTKFHVLDDPDEYEKYKMRKCRYNRIFSEFLNGKIDKHEMIKKMDEVEIKDISNFQPFEELRIVDLETKEEKIGSIGFGGLVERCEFGDLADGVELVELRNNQCFSHWF